MPMIASCGIWLARFPVKEKIARAQEGETKCNSEGGPAMKIETKEQRHANPERSHLRHRDVDEDDAALDDMKPEIDKQPRQENAGHDGPEHYFPHVKKSES